MSIENDIMAQTVRIDSAIDSDRLALLVPPLPDSAELTVRCAPNDFLASSIARAVEDCNAHLINLNVTGQRHTDGSLLIHLRVNRRGVDSVARSLERHGFSVVDGGSDTDNGNIDLILAERANQLLHILNV